MADRFVTVENDGATPYKLPPLVIDGSVGTVAGTLASGDAVATAQAAAESAASVAGKNLRVAPSMTIYGTSRDLTVLYQDGATMYAKSSTTVGQILKTTNGGTTWTVRGLIGWDPLMVAPIVATGTLIGIQLTNRTLTGQNPSVKRSTDDGATWTEVDTFTHPGLGHQGFLSLASGEMLIGEYGNTANTVYSVMRTVDDGLTWTPVLSSPGTDVVSDPGHIHSVTYDPVADQVVAFMDRPTPEIYASDDRGATWTKIGNVTQLYHPNFVAPMYFDNYIAWGVDNSAGGHIYRLSRADFYSGNWGSPELIGQVNKRAFYDTFEVRPGVWMLSGSAESIGGDPSPGSYLAEVYIVSDDGEIVTGGVAVGDPEIHPSVLNGRRAAFPGFRPSADQLGRTYLTVTVESVDVSAPVTVGVAPPMPQRTDIRARLVIPSGRALWAEKLDGTKVPLLSINPTSNDVNLFGNVDTSGLRVLGINGDILLRVGGQLIRLSAAGLFLHNLPLYFGTGGAPAAFVRAGTGSPEGVVTAAVGSLYTRTDGIAGQTLYVKETGGGSTGWVAK